MRRLVLVPLLSILSASVPGQAQDIPPTGYTVGQCTSFFKNLGSSAVPTTQGREMALADRAIVEQTTPLGADGIAPVLRSEVALTATEAGGRALIQLSGEADDSMGAFTEWSVKASAPFDKDEGEGQLVSGSGISGDFVLATSLSWTAWKLQEEDYGKALCTACVSAGVHIEKCNLDGLEALWLTTRWQDLAEADREKRAQAERQTILGPLWGNTPLRLWGFETLAGRKERKFFEVDGTTGSEDRIAYSAGVYGGVVLKDVWAIYGEGSWKRDYKQKDSAELCTPIEGSPLESCKSLPLGRADERDFLVLSIQGIGYFPLPGSKRNWAFAPVIAYDFEESDWEIQLPAYLVTNSDGDFTGGIKATWAPDQDEEWTFGVFVTKPLEAWN